MINYDNMSENSQNLRDKKEELNVGIKRHEFQSID